MQTIKTRPINTLRTRTKTNSLFRSISRCFSCHGLPGLGNRLCYEITFNSYDQVIQSPDPKNTAAGQKANPDGKYKITNISLEYDIVTNPTLARQISMEYQNMGLLYERVLRHRQIRVNKSDTTWNWSFNTPTRSLKGILAIFEDEAPWKRNTSKFYNPKITKVSSYCGGGGEPNQLFAQGMQPFEHYSEYMQIFRRRKTKG